MASVVQKEPSNYAKSFRRILKFMAKISTMRIILLFFLLSYNFLSGQNVEIQLKNLEAKLENLRQQQKEVELAIEDLKMQKVW